VRGIPVGTNETRREELMAELVLAGGSDGVVEEKGVTKGSVDDSVQDVSNEFALIVLLGPG
jgi:hypothetical protein